jgi:hypothetical protein
MKKIFIIVASVIIVLALGIAPVSGQGSFPWVTDKAEFDQVKIAQVPLPWQFWAIDTATGQIIDRIRISPTWITGPSPLPPGEGAIQVRVQWATIASIDPIPLKELVWEGGRPMPEMPNIGWHGGDQWQSFEWDKETESFFDVFTEISLDSSSNIVLVAYEVGLQMATGSFEEVGHFVNEAVLERTTNPGTQIVQVFVNFDVHNATGTDVTDFELDFAGLSFGPEDILWALGFVKASGEPWGANEQNPLVVRPIKAGTVDGTEVKWVQLDRPLKTCEWLHLGLSFKLEGLVSGVNATVQGYWTQVIPKAWCVETVNPAGNNIPPAGYSTKPGTNPNSGKNPDGFYQLFAKGAVIPGGPLKIYVVDSGSGVRFGPFMVGDRIKYTEANGAVPDMKLMGSTGAGNNGKSEAIVAHITGKGDMNVYAVDYLGHKSKLCICPVPPPPK